VLPEALPELAARLSEAGELAKRIRAELQVFSKPDGSIVTNADRAIETLFRERLPEIVPGASVWGEEFGHESPTEAGQWLIDPIDGTTNFAWGSPLWGVSVGLFRGDRVVLGGLYLPDLDEMYLCAQGHGVTLNGRELPHARPGAVKVSEPIGYCEAVARLGYVLPGRQRCAGAFVVEAAFVMAGRLRGMIGLRESLYDVAPCVLFGEELGYEVRYADGDAIDWASLTAPVSINRPWLIFPPESGFILRS
jgi:myo-inositol-1(or 4)-monophosphatase